jgi:hypothetical protein
MSRYADKPFMVPNPRRRCHWRLRRLIIRRNMLINQALPEVLQLGASQLFQFSSVVFACLAPVTKNRKLAPWLAWRNTSPRPIGTDSGTGSGAKFRRGQKMAAPSFSCCSTTAHAFTTAHFLYRVLFSFDPSYKQVRRGLPWAVVSDLRNHDGKGVQRVNEGSPARWKLTSA